MPVANANGKVIGAIQIVNTSHGMPFGKEACLLVEAFKVRPRVRVRPRVKAGVRDRVACFARVAGSFLNCMLCLMAMKDQLHAVPDGSQGPIARLKLLGGIRYPLPFDRLLAIGLQVYAQVGILHFKSKAVADQGVHFDVASLEAQASRGVSG